MLVVQENNQLGLVALRKLARGLPLRFAPCYAGVNASGLLHFRRCFLIDCAMSRKSFQKRNYFYNSSNEIEDTANKIAITIVEMKIVLSAPRLV